MNVNSLGSLNVTKPRTFTMQFPPAGQPPTDFNPIAETVVREVFDQQTRIATSHVAADNGKADNWSRDIDPDAGRVVRTLSAPVCDQKTNTTVAMALTFDLNKRPTALDMTSEDGKLEKHVRWSDGQVTYSMDRRTLSDRTETVQITVDPKTGVLTYTESNS